jgi:hypothetical protein
MRGIYISQMLQNTGDALATTSIYVDLALEVMDEEIQKHAL